MNIRTIAKIIYERNREKFTHLLPWEELPSRYKHEFIIETWLIILLVQKEREKLIADDN